MIEQLLDIRNIVSVLTIIGVAIAWLFERRITRASLDKIRSDGKGAEAGALKEMQTVYDKFVLDVKKKDEGREKQMEELKIEVDQLQKRVKELEVENKELTSKNRNLNIEIEELKLQVEILNRKIDILKKL